MVDAVNAMQRSCFYKSMTAYHDPSSWQDVYHVPFEGLTLYVKFTAARISAFMGYELIWLEGC